MQRDLFTHTGFTITPESGRNEPRLWVRRLAIWSEAGQIIRDISVKAGFQYRVVTGCWHLGDRTDWTWKWKYDVLPTSALLLG